MFKPSPRLYGRLRRLPLTTKQTNKGYYKGSGTGLLGTINKKGKFKFDLDRVRTFVVPRELDTTKLTPFVSRNDVQNQHTGEGWEKQKKNFTGESYLDLWKNSRETEDGAATD
ncbi:hypothetical protein BDV96DRAFT_195510 [Lophiotrema nucula]|uniref:Mitochondrial ribosomal protein L27-domain-containing protein n=1 Tax=Lophiotrema nucula TaxID=690887 RepID=A0A6A5YUH3_9PLEO|nr:hypothetical protein BDV96DRAFT_195510 [Lophiotrema nucula]